MKPSREGPELKMLIKFWEHKGDVEGAGNQELER